MGNCVFKGLHNEVLEDMTVKVVTLNGGIMEFYSPITVECITSEFSGHGIFQKPPRDMLSSEPLLDDEELQGGQVYYLLPLNPTSSSSAARAQQQNILEASTTLTPYRMSTCEKNSSNNNHNSSYKKMMRWETHEVFPRYNNAGVWKVKLVISPEKLSEILSQEARTEALIESVRTVAKCGGGGGGVPSAANSDQYSVCSSTWKGSTLGVDS